MHTIYEPAVAQAKDSWKKEAAQDVVILLRMLKHTVNLGSAGHRVAFDCLGFV